MIAEATPTPTPSPENEIVPTYTPAVTSGGTAKLFKKTNDQKVYVQKSDGTLSWVKTLNEFNSAGYSWSNVRTVSGTELVKMPIGGNVKVVNGISFLRVRSSSSTAGKIAGKVLPGQVLPFTQISSNGWYKISSGWVSGAYVKEY